MEIKPDMKATFCRWSKVHRQYIYDCRIIDFAIAWANLMEKHLAEGKTLKDILLTDSFLVDDRGIQSAELSYAIKMLGTFWIHGDEFLNVYNEFYVGG